MHTMTTTDTQDQISKRNAWYKIIEDYNASGQNQTIYCKQRDINKDHFSYYLGRWRKDNSKVMPTISFHPVEVVKSHSRGKWLLHIASGLSLELPDSASMQQLSELILNLRKSLC
ncbi:MAG TPA: hypothetical protein VLG38_00540 [Gammaproteobacteria bacterium]|nr:hypothetical protein [Gammaproteobacteria bacterium]